MAVLLSPFDSPAIGTDGDGRVVLDRLEPGRYTVLVVGLEGVGWRYAPQARSGVYLRSGDHAAIEFRLARVDSTPPVHYPKANTEQLSDYADTLRALGEPPMCEYRVAQGEASLSFLWLRSFHPPVHIRLVVGPGDKANVTYKALSGERDGKLGESFTVDAFDRVLSDLENEDQTRSLFAQVVEDAEDWLWDTPHRIDDGRIGVDGALWIIEGIQGDRCNIVNRWSPERTDSVRVLSNTIIRLSGKRFYYDEVY